MICQGEGCLHIPADDGMIVTDYATAPEPDNLCPNCGFDSLVERGCKVICGHCRGLIQSCSE